ncbi:MAG: Gfo/Idh/MocA family protein [Verrucomicrobiota bacterium]
MLSPQFQGRSTVRWGIIGCGDVTEVKSGPGFRHARGSQLVAVMRRNGALAADYAKRHGVPRWYDDAGALLADPEVDAVYVATPPDTHCHYALLAAAAGKPAYVEKPMARHTPECDRMIEAFACAGQKLFVAYYRRSLPRWQRVLEGVESGELGRLTGVTYRLALPKHREPPAWRTRVEQAGAGHFLDLASHVLDLVDFLAGPLTSVQGLAANVASAYAAEDTVACSFAAGGVPGVLSCNFAAISREDLLVLTGTKGEVRTPVLDNDQPVLFETAEGLQRWDFPPPPHLAQPLIQACVDDLLGRDTCPSTGESARRTSQVMDAVLDAYYGGRQDEFWLRPGTWPGRRP